MSEAPAALKVATYNIHGAVGCDRRYAPERIARVLLELDADIVALQEVLLGGARGERVNVLTLLSKSGGYYAAEGPTIDMPGRRYGNAVLSRYPIRAVRNINLAIQSREPRGALDADIECRRHMVRVVATHLGLGAAERSHQVECLLQAFDTRDMPVILLGDLNEWLVWGQPLRRLLTHFLRGRAPATFPTWWPLFALDRIWIHPGEALREVSVHRSALARIASDHFPLLARIDWPPRANQERGG